MLIMGVAYADWGVNVIVHLKMKMFQLLSYLENSLMANLTHIPQHLYLPECQSEWKRYEPANLAPKAFFLSFPLIWDR